MVPKVLALQSVKEKTNSLCAFFVKNNNDGIWNDAQICVQGHRYTWLHDERLDGNEYWSQWEMKAIHLALIFFDNCLCSYLSDRFFSRAFFFSGSPVGKVLEASFCWWELSSVQRSLLFARL